MGFTGLHVLCFMSMMVPDKKKRRESRAGNLTVVPAIEFREFGLHDDPMFGRGAKNIGAFSYLVACFEFLVCIFCYIRRVSQLR